MSSNDLLVNSHVPELAEHGCLLIEPFLRANQRDVVETCDAPTVTADHRRDGRVGAIILVREVGPNRLVHRVEHIRTVHEREGGNIGQVDLDQFR
ncbi:MAG: hypothetical protein ACK2U1_12300, partial [Anaerolineales bacterium]